MHVQGFSGRAATTTMHGATATGVSVSGILQAAEDFAVLCFYNAWDYFNHLRLKHLPETDLSGLKLEFDIEYDQTLDGAIRFDAAKYPSVSWDAVTFVCGAGDIYEVRLLDHATVVAGGETSASCSLDANGAWPTDGLDWLHLYFRDTRYTVASDQVEGTAYDVMVRFAEIINTPAQEAVEKSLRYAFVGRRRKKRDFRSLWIVRISAAAKNLGLSYSKFMDGLKKAGIDLNRKILAEMAYVDEAGFKLLVDKARAAVEKAG